jgi:formylmethanofuran dehydrogenase subunit E
MILIAGPITCQSLEQALYFKVKTVLIHNQLRERQIKMEYIIILAVAAVVGYFFYKRRSSSNSDSQVIRETYVCDKCGENVCECHKEDTDH